MVQQEGSQEQTSTPVFKDGETPGGMDILEAKRLAAVAALRNNAPSSFEFNGKKTVITVEEAREVISPTNLRRHIEDLRGEENYHREELKKIPESIGEIESIGREFWGDEFPPPPSEPISK